MGHTDAPMSVKTVAPPACTSLICSMKTRQSIIQPESKYTHSNTECSTDVEQPSSDPIPCPQLLECIRLILLEMEQETGSQPTLGQQTEGPQSQSGPYPLLLFHYQASLQIKLPSQLSRRLLKKGGGYKRTETTITLYQNQAVGVTMATDRCPALHRT